MIYKMTLKDSADEMTFDLLEVPIVDKDIEGAVDNVTLDGNQYTDYLWLKKQFIQKWSILCDDEYTRLRGFYTRQFENADVPSYRLYYGDDIIRNSTLSGERIELSISGVADGTMSLTQMDGNIEQTTYTGKNLLNITDKTSTTNGITRTAKDGKLTFSGTASAYTQGFYEAPNITANEPMILSANRASLSGVTIKLTVERGGSNIYPDLVTTYQLQTGDILKQIYFIIANGATTSGSISPQLEKGSTATAYEPYIGGIPAPNQQFPQPIETVTGRQTVTVTGKNLLKLFTDSFTAQGITTTVNADGSFTYAGTTTTTWADLSPTISNTIPAGTYTLSKQTNRSYTIRFNHADNTNTQMNLTSASTSVALQKDVVSYRFWVWGLTASTQYNATERLQLELGSQASAYEPYKGQNYEINLGKNLINTNIALSDQYLNTNGGWATGTYTEYLNDEWANIPGASYTFTASERKTNSTYLRFGQYKADGTFISRTLVSALNQTITTTSECYKVVISLNNSESSCFVNPMLEKGSTASSYSAYFTPIELCKIGTYQDRIYKENGKWWLHKEIGEVVFDGSENWSLLNSGSTNFYYNLPVFVTPKDQDIMPVSNYFVGTPITNGNTSVGLWITSAGTIRARKETEQTLADYKTWLASNNVTVYYVLATPTTTEITNEALVEELEALQDEAISVGLHNIYTDTPNALPTLTFDLTEYLSKSTTIIPETAVRLALTDGGVINACGCRKDVQLTMRETIE